MKSHTAHFERVHRHITPALAAIGGRVAGTAAGKAATTGAARSGVSPAVAKVTGQAVGGAVGESVQSRLGGRTEKSDTVSPTATNPPDSKLAGSTFGSLSMLRKGTDALGESVQSFSEESFLQNLGELDKVIDKG